MTPDGVIEPLDVVEDICSGLVPGAIVFALGALSLQRREEAQLTDYRRFRILTIVDDCTRESLALVADTLLSGIRVAREICLR